MFDWEKLNLVFVGNWRVKMARFSLHLLLQLRSFLPKPEHQSINFKSKKTFIDLLEHFQKL